MTAADSLRELLARPGVLHLPGVYDPVSALLARTAGFGALYLSGAVTSAVALGRPDLGYVHGSDIAALGGRVAAASGLPVVADADTGYGNALQARQTVEAYAAAGLAGLHLEDQVAPKRCGHLQGKAVIDAAEAAAKVRAAVDAGTGLVVIGRTDALSVHGLDEACRRAALLAEAGADLVFVEGAATEAELAAVHAATPGTGKVLNRSEAGGDVAGGLPDEVLARHGVTVVLHPVSALLAAAAAARDTYAAIARAGSAGGVPRLGWPDLTDLLGLPEVLELERRYAVQEVP